MRSLPNLQGVSLISKMGFFHVVLVANAAPGLMEAVAGRLSFRVNTAVAGFHKCWEVVCHAFPLSKTEGEQTWMTHWY